MMKQLLDGFNTLKAGQIGIQEAVREICERTAAKESHAAEIEKMARATLLIFPQLPDHAIGGGAARPPTLTSSMETGFRSSDHRATNLYRGDAPGILGNRMPAPDSILAVSYESRS
jgi:hypothetical protein